MRSLAIALCAPCIFYGLLGLGTTLIVWAMIEFDPWRPDVYACFFAAAGPISFLVHLERQRRHTEPIPIGIPVLLNLGCTASAVVLALTRTAMLGQPSLLIVLLMLFFGPLLNVAVLRTE